MQCGVFHGDPQDVRDQINSFLGDNDKNKYRANPLPVVRFVCQSEAVYQAPLSVGDGWSGPAGEHRWGRKNVFI